MKFEVFLLGKFCLPLLLFLSLARCQTYQQSGQLQNHLDSVDESSKTNPLSPEGSGIVSSHPSASPSMFYYQHYPTQNVGKVKPFPRSNSREAQGYGHGHGHDHGQGHSHGYESQGKGWSMSSEGTSGWGSGGGQNQGWSMTEDTMNGGWGQEDEKEGGGEGAGLIGLLGLLGLKGLKPYLTTILSVLFAPLLLPILIPVIGLVLLALLAPFLLLLFIPIPVIVTPGARSVEGGVKLASFGLPSLAKEVLESEECVERISCEIARVSRDWKLDGFLSSLTGRLPSEGKYSKKILAGVNSVGPRNARKTSPETERECGVFNCRAKSILVKHFNQEA